MMYTVTGAVVTLDDGSGVALANAQGLSAQVTQFTATVRSDPVHLHQVRPAARTPLFPATLPPPAPRALRSPPSGMARGARVRSSQSTSGFLRGSCHQ